MPRDMSGMIFNPAGSRVKSGGGLGWSTRWPGWMCCCTGSAGPCRSRPPGRPDLPHPHGPRQGPAQGLHRDRLRPVRGRRAPAARRPARGSVGRLSGSPAVRLRPGRRVRPPAEDRRKTNEFPELAPAIAHLDLICAVMTWMTPPAGPVTITQLGQLSATHPAVRSGIHRG
jgi:hypothetical protein